MSNLDWSCGMKSARRKKQLVKKDRDKRLIALWRRYSKLSKYKWSLPFVEIEQPYQRGWKRYFVLHDDLRYNPRKDFFEALLEKINTVEYHHDQDFKFKKRKKKRSGYEYKRQFLREFASYEWIDNKMKLTEEEQAYFMKVETYNVYAKRTSISYVFTEPWRYKLKVAPHFVTHARKLDIEIERELAFVNNHINKNFLWPRIDRLTSGKGYRGNRFLDEKPKYKNRFKNIPRYSSKERFLELDI